MTFAKEVDNNMTKAPEVKVIAINGDYGYTMIELATTNEPPMSFVVQYDTTTKEYRFSQCGENNTWHVPPDERK